MSTPQELVQRLIESGLTQMDIARHTGMSQSTISRLRSGKTQDTTVHNWQRLCALYEKQRPDA